MRKVNFQRRHFEFLARTIKDMLKPPGLALGGFLLPKLLEYDA
jgi:hypothetical protein